MAKVYFRKELVANSYMVEGQAVPFEVLDGGRGVIQLDSDQDAKLIAALNIAAQKQVGGVVRSNETEYAELKKNYPFPSSQKQQSKKDVLRVIPADLSPSRAKPVNAPAPDGKMRDAAGLLLDGPSKEEWIARGYAPHGYPPFGYAPVSLEQKAKSLGKTVDELLAQIKADALTPFEERHTPPPPPAPLGNATATAPIGSVTTTSEPVPPPAELPTGKKDEPVKPKFNPAVKKLPPQTAKPDEEQPAKTS